MTIEPEKAVVRAQVRAALQALTDEKRRAASAAVCRHLRQTIFQTAQTLLFYAPLPGEVDVWPLLKAALASGKTVSLPRFDAATGKYEARVLGRRAGEMVVGAFGIREPSARCSLLAPARADWILVPGLAFDQRGQRLGRGRGYYDRLLLEIAGRRCGVAFDQQVLAVVPSEPHDLRMNALVTPTRGVQPLG